MVDIGARVRELRLKKNWSLEKPAEEAQLQRSTVYNAESRAQGHRPDTLRKIARGLGIEVEELYDIGPE